jgi:hypothetical protein
MKTREEVERMVREKIAPGNAHIEGLVLALLAVQDIAYREGLNLGREHASLAALDRPTLTDPCRSVRIDGKPACSKEMTWTYTTYWRALCGCGFSTRAASGDAMHLNERAGR